MKRLTVYLLVLVLLVAGASLAVYRAWRGGPAPELQTSGEQPAAAGTGPARVLLNEILFQPAPGQPPWVELVNAGGESGSLDGVVLENQTGERYALPAGLTLPSGGLLLVRFDGTAQIAETKLHAPQTGFLHRETGSLALFTGGDATDEARWSTAGGPSFSLGRGGHIPTLVAGTTLGRPPGSIRRGAVAWTVFDPADATPGAPNPFPAVTGLITPIGN